MKCTFCGKSDFSDLIRIEEHHLLPTTVRSAMGWRGKKARVTLKNYKLPLCGTCHDKLTLFIEPLVKIIEYTRVSPIPVEYTFTLNSCYKQLSKNSGGTADV